MITVFRVASLLVGLCVWIASCQDLLAQQPQPAEGDETQLIAVLKSDAALFDKAKACQRLAVIGTPASVPVLADLLANPALSHYARFALEAIPGQEVDAALRESLGKLSGAQLVGAVSSIGVRGDAAAVGALKPFLTSTDRQLATAAAMSLARIASPEAVEALVPGLSGPENARPMIAAACLAAADVLLTRGKHAEAAGVLDALLHADLPKHLNIAARVSALRAADSVQDVMTEYLKNADPDLFRIGLALAHARTDSDTTQKLVALLDSLPIPRRVLLLYALGNRGDKAALPAVLRAAQGEQADLRLAAVRVLGALGDDSAIPVLLAAALSSQADLAEQARDSLANLPGDAVDAILVARLSSSSADQRLPLIDVIGRRGVSAAVPLLLTYAAADDAQLRTTAIEALGMTVGPGQLPTLVDRLLAATSPEAATTTKEALVKACQRMPDRDAAAAMLLERLPRANPAGKSHLFDLLVAVGGGKSLEGIVAAAKSGDTATKDAATRALGQWLNPDAAPALLELAQSGDEAYRVRCLRGYIRIIRQFGIPNNERLEMCRAAMSAATRDDERLLVLDALTRITNPASLNMAASYLDNPALREAAAASTVAIGERIVNATPQPVARAMPKVLAATKDQALTNRAKVLLERAGGANQ